MTLYLYECPNHGELEVQHPMADVHKVQHCPECGAELKRKLTPTHRFWPSNVRPGFEESAQRAFLNPDRQAREKDKLAEMKEEHERRESAPH